MKISNVTIRRRIFFLIMFVTIFFGALIIRLGYVQLWAGQSIASKAESLWRRELPFKANRGQIWDRNGIPLTYNISTPTIMAIPAQIRDARKTADELAGVLGMKSEDIYKIITKKQMNVYIKPGGRKITLDKAKQIQALHLQGIEVTEDNKRYYPFGSLAAGVLGITGIDNQGLTGVELSYDKYLTGLNGSISYLSTASGELMPGSTENYRKPQDGLDLELTLDKNIQSIIERELDQAQLTFQPDHILAIAMDPNNGEILGMASRPTFEPARFQDYPSQVYNRNLPIWMTYEPGSTFKIITLAAALQENKVDLTHDHFFDSGAIEVGGATLHCWKRGGHGSETFLQVVENSCNPGFVVLGQRLGKDTLFKYIRDFGFGKKTGIDLKGEENGIMFKPSRVGPVELATTAFGQGVSVTPIQQITAVSAAINGGKLYWPHVGKAWINPETNEVVSRIQPKMERQVISAETSGKVRNALESVVANGTGGNAYIDGYRMGGKTGTAQKVVNGRYSPNEHIVSFIGFAPADHPKVIVYVAVDNPKGIQFGGVVAAPIVKNIMGDTLRYLGVPPSKDQMAKKYKYGEVKYVEVPDLIGMTVNDIYEDMNDKFRLAASGAGKVVVSQAPKPGVRVEQGSTIRIYLSNSNQE